MDTIFRRIAHHADLDVRRALGVFDRVRIPEGFHGRTMSPTSLRWFPRKRTIMYTDFRPSRYEFSVYTNVDIRDEIIYSYTHSKTYEQNGGYVYLVEYCDMPIPFASGDIITVIDQTEEDEPTL